MIEAIIILGLICIIQTIERYFYQKDMTNKLNDSIKAVMSRNINEYLTAITTPKTSKEIKGEPDQINLDESDDATFEKAIKRM